MTVACQTLIPSFTLISRSNMGSSEQAQILRKTIDESLRHYTLPRIESIKSEIEQMVEDSARTTEMAAESSAIDRETAAAALQFAVLLPRSLPAPEVAPEPDGEISFDWAGPSGKMFSVSVNRAGRLAYAGRYGDKSRVHGIEQISDGCSDEIIRGIGKTLA